MKADYYTEPSHLFFPQAQMKKRLGLDSTGPGVFQGGPREWITVPQVEETRGLIKTLLVKAQVPGHWGIVKSIESHFKMKQN